MSFRLLAKSWHLCIALALPVWCGSEQVAQAQVLAQSGTAKTAIGYVLVILAIALGLIVVLRPSKRKMKEKKKQAAQQKH